MSGGLISPSAIALEALGLPPTGDLIGDADTYLACAMCGTGIGPGDVHGVLDLPASFTNQLAMAIPGGKHICGACRTVMTNNAFQMKFATALVSRDGYFPIMRKEHRAWAFLTPPKPPFFVTIQNAQQQHVVWRAPVSLSQDLILVRVGEQIVRLRRPKLIEAREVALRLQAERDRLVDAAKKPKKDSSAPKAGAESVESPFVADWKFQSASGGTLKHWARVLIDAGVVPDADRAVLTSLNAGEVWALQAALHLNPTQPSPLVFDDQTEQAA